MFQWAENNSLDEKDIYWRIRETQQHWLQLISCNFEMKEITNKIKKWEKVKWIELIKEKYQTYRSDFVRKSWKYAEEN